MKLIAVLTAALLAGCAATSNITPMGRDTFLMTKQAATGFPGLGNMKAEVLTEANAFCAQSKKSMEVLQTSESRPPFILGNYPRVEVQFACR
jgi:hypothetical protein